MSGKELFSYIFKSKFVRSVFMRILAIFTLVCIVIVVVAFYSFTSDVSSTILADKQRQLAVVEESVSKRMDEITSIAYNIGNDSIFYLEPVETTAAEKLELSNTLKRYIVGNTFIEHLAFCRTAEPDKIYTSAGERSLSEFFIGSLGMEKEKSDELIQGIQKQNTTSVRVYGVGENAYFGYLYPLPQLSTTPKAHVLALIPFKEISPLMETLFLNSRGNVEVFDASGNRIFQVGNLDDEISLTDFMGQDSDMQSYTGSSGQKYDMLKVVSDNNGWTYVSVIRHSDTLSGLGTGQISLLLFMLILFIAAIVAMLIIIVRQFKPISKLAKQAATEKAGADNSVNVVDERKLLTHTIATLKNDSDQKQKFESAYYEAEAASKAKSSFLSSMSHDIRTPMNAIVGMTSLALKHKDDSDYVEQCLKKVKLSSDYLLDIINNVLDMSRIESGNIPIANDPVYICALIDSLVSLMTSSIEAKSQTLEVTIDEDKQYAVLGDSVHIIQVFVNILSNAVKFTPEGGKLSIKVTQTEAQEKNYVNYTFVFSDTGIGMPPEFISQVFDTFTRANVSGASKTEGTGLGMAIAKRLVELMDGTITCESELGQGSTFTVTMHMELADEGEIASMSSRSGAIHRSGGNSKDVSDLDLKGKRILLVEDNAMNTEIANAIIGETGAEVVNASNGKQAIDIFSENPVGYFDLIFMDIQMPIMNGYEATAEIRSMDRADAATIPIYAMTANTFDEDVRQVKDAGMNGHIGKPYDAAILYRILMQVFSEQDKEIMQ